MGTSVSFPGSGGAVTDPELLALASTTSAAGKLPYFTGAGTATTTDLSAYGQTLIALANAGALRTDLALVVGTNVQAFDATLASLAGYNTNGILTQTAADTFAGRTLTAGSAKIGVTNGSGVAGNPTVDLGSVALNDLSDGSTAYRSGGTDVAVVDGGTGASTAGGARTNLGLVIGTDVQAQDAELAAIAGLTSAADKVPYFTGSGTAALATQTTFARTILDDADASTVRTTIGLGANPQGSFATLADRWAAQIHETVNPAAASMLAVPGLPGGAPVGTRAYQVNLDYYFPIFCSSYLTFDQVAVEVSTASGSAGSVGRVGLYAATSSWQPTGTLIEEFGTIATDSTGVKTLTVNGATTRTLPGGRYVLALNVNGATVTLRTVKGSPSTLFVSTLGASPSVALFSVSRAHAAFPSTGSTWTTAPGAATGFDQAIFLRVTAEAA